MKKNNLLYHNYPTKKTMIKEIINKNSILWDKNENGIIEMMKQGGINTKKEMLKTMENNMKKWEITKIQYRYLEIIK